MGTPTSSGPMLSKSNKAQTLSVAIAAILVWVVGLAGVTIPADVALSLTVVLTFVVGAFVKD